MASEDTVLDICSTIKSRGPRAYKNFLLSLNESGHNHISNILESYGSSNKVCSSNNNITENLEQLNISNESSNSSNLDEYSK